MRVFIAGPMTGIPEFNFPAFHLAEAWLTANGFDPYSPARADLDEGFDPTGMVGTAEELRTVGFDYDAAMSRNLTQIGSCHAVVLLDGWANSSGAVMECDFAAQLGLPIMRFFASPNDRLAGLVSPLPESA